MVKNNQTGFTLVEVIIALLVFSVGVLAVLSMKTKAVINNGVSRQQSVASELCVNVIERLIMCDYWEDPDDATQNLGDTLIDVTDAAGIDIASGNTDFGITYPDSYGVNYVVQETPDLHYRLLTVSVTWPNQIRGVPLVMEYVLPRDK